MFHLAFSDFILTEIFLVAGAPRLGVRFSGSLKGLDTTWAVTEAL